MKIQFIILMIISGVNVGVAQVEPDLSYTYKNTLKVSVTQFFASEYRLTYERYNTKHRLSAAVSIGYVLNKKPSIWFNQNVFTQLQGTGGNLQLKYHMFNKYGAIVTNRKQTSIVDIYSAPYIQYFRLKYVDENVTYLTDGFQEELYRKGEPYIDIINAYEAGIMLGIEFAIHQRFIINLYGGAGYRVASTQSSENVPLSWEGVSKGYWSRGYTGLVPRMGINFGFTF